MDGAFGPARRGLLRGAGLFTAGAAIGVASFAEAIHVRPPIAGGPASSTVGNHGQHAGAGELRVTWTVRTSRSLVALTFDDGPRRLWTPMVLDTLERYGVPATFFMVGERARSAAAEIKGRMSRHEVANHSWAHHDLAGMDADRAYHDLHRAHVAIAEVTGREPTLMRPPYGHLGGGALLAAARLDYRVVLWSLQMEESDFPGDPVGHARRMVASAEPGSILLAHDVGANKRLVTLKGLPNLITGLRGRGFEFVTVSQLVSEA
jgi:peptidoglycan/xylan/chitin deacetylase (PgdA/CDA1 family)